MIQNEHELEVTRQRIKAFQDALMALRHNQLPITTPRLLRTSSTKSKEWKQKCTTICSAVPRLKILLVKIPSDPNFPLGGSVGSSTTLAVRPHELVDPTG